LMQTFAVGLDWSVANTLGKLGVAVTSETFGYPLWKLKLSQVAPILPFLLLVVMLIVRPKGIMGTRDD
jgi:branched-chain amino acid transport system permease protein